MNPSSDIQVTGNLPDAVILCGGAGTRIRPVLGDHPKALADVQGRPFLQIMLGYLRAEGVRRVILCAGQGAESIEAFCRASGDPSILISREASPLGTAGALRNAAHLIRSSTFLVLNGDSYCPVSLTDLLQEHLAHCPTVTMVVADLDSVSDYGCVTLGPGNAVTGFVEKPPQDSAGTVNAGTYVMERSALDTVPPGRPCSLEREVFPALLDGRLRAYVTRQLLFDIGTPDRLARIQHTELYTPSREPSLAEGRKSRA